MTPFVSETTVYDDLEQEYSMQFDSLLPQIEQICKEELPDYETPLYYMEIEKIPYTPNNKQDFRLL